MTAPTFPSRITSVTVYRNEAAITRVGEIDLSGSAVPEEVRLIGLPLCLDDGSVTAKVDAVGEGSAPEACDIRIGLDVPPPDPDLAPPRNEQLREAERAVSELQSEIEQLEQMVARLEGLNAPDRPQGERGKAPPPAPTEARLALFQFRQSELEKLGGKRTALLKQLEEARDALDVMRRRDQAASTSRQAREHELRKSVVVRLRKTIGESLAPTCRLTVEYLVPGARWIPNYAIRFNEKNDSAELAMRAQLCQDTGEDWENVSLRVATTDPERWSELPELPALRIGRRQPTPPRTGWRPPPTGVDELFADYDRVAESGGLTDARLAEEPTRSITRDEFEAQKAIEFDGLEESALLAGAESEEEVEEAGFFMGTLPPDEMAELEMSAPPVTASPSPSFAAKATRSVMPSHSSDGVLAGMAVPTEVRTELTAATDMLNYARLRLGGAQDSARGFLRPVTQEESYVEFLARFHMSVEVSLSLALALASTRARRVAEKEPPHGYFVPGPWEGFDYSYAAAAAVTVPSDSNFHNIPLSTHPGSCELRYVAVPREDPEVYRFLDLTNPLETPLPEGPADVYVDGDYLLTARLHTVAPKGKIELGLGVEEGVKVARNVRFSERTSGLLGGNLGLSHEIAVDVTNNLSKDADIEIRERVPVVREGDDKVSVQIVDVDPPWERFDQDRRQIEGAFHWRITVPSGATRTLTANYVISLSSKHEIVGGNRREE